MDQEWNRFVEGYEEWKKARGEWDAVIARLKAGEEVDREEWKATLKVLDEAHARFVGMAPSSPPKRA